MNGRGVHFFVYGEPMTQGYLDKWRWATAVRESAREAMQGFAGTIAEVEIELWFWMPGEKNHKRRDALISVALNELEGILYEHDSQVRDVLAHVRKRPEAPGLTVRVRVPDEVWDSDEHS
jgi:hypothetical protein